MNRAFDQFRDNIRQIRELEALHNYLKNTQMLPNDLSDLLRMQWMYAVSALDKLIHEIVRIGMLESFAGTRIKTPAFNAFPITLETLDSILAATTPPKEHWFELEVIQKHKIQSFQDPDKISEALSLIWNENHKWQNICFPLGLPQKDVRVKLKNIVIRRNQIVHEADINPLTGMKENIDALDTKDVVDFIEQLCGSIFNLVK